MKVIVEDTINAKIDRVFDVFSDIGKVKERIEGITDIKIHSSQTSGLGVNWTETRTMFGKEATETMEMTEFDAPNFYKVEAFSHGTKYTSTYKFLAEAGNTTKVILEFTGEPKSFLAKLMSPLAAGMKGSVAKAFKKDFDDLKKVIES